MRLRSLRRPAVRDPALTRGARVRERRRPRSAAAGSGYTRRNGALPEGVLSPWPWPRPCRIFQPAYHVFVDGKLDVFLNERAGSVMAQVSGPLRAALVLYVLLYGFAILRGAIQEPFMDFVVPQALKLAFIYMLATTVAYSRPTSPSPCSTSCPTP